MSTRTRKAATQVAPAANFIVSPWSIKLPKAIASPKDAAVLAAMAAGVVTEVREARALNQI